MNATPREPFDAEEARLARLYGSLPRGEPSPALDARILAQARAAVAANAPAKRRPWFLGAGLGTAAAAVFAAGIAWQLGAFKADRGLSSVPEQQPAVEEELDRVDIEFVKQEQKREDAAKPPVTLEPQAAGEARKQAAADRFAEKERSAAPSPFPAEAPAAVAAPPPPAPAVATEAISPEPMQDAVAPQPETAAAAPAAPAPTSGPSLDDLRASKDDAADADTESQAVLSRHRAGRDREGAADTRTEPAPAVSGIAAPGRTASNAAAAGAGLGERNGQLGKLTGLPPWAEDAALAPEPWLERIRDRVQAGDRQGAEHSLRRFVLAHPERPVPRDLQRLLVE